MQDAMRYFELEDEDPSDILDMDEETPISPYTPLIPPKGGARERFVTESAKHPSVLRLGLPLTVCDWDRMLDAAIADTYTDTTTGRVVTMRDIA